MSMSVYSPDPSLNPAIWTESALMSHPETRAQQALMPAIHRTQETIHEFAPIMSADIMEGPDDFHMQVDLPGVHKDDLDITISNGRLNIVAERKEIHRERALRVHKIERSFGKVKRSLAIPVGADESTADAKFDKGVLTVTFRKTPEAMAGKKLTVKVT